MRTAIRQFREHLLGHRAADTGSSRVDRLLTTAVVLIGIVARCWAPTFQSVAPDGIANLELARRFSFARPWAASFREPGWIALVKATAAPFAYRPGAAQALSLVCSVIALVAFACLARQVLGDRGALVAVVLVAIHPQLIVDAGMGIREPLGLLALVIATWLCVEGRHVALAILAGFVCGLRWELGLLMLAVLACGVAVRHMALRALGTGLASAVLVMGPFVAASGAKYQDPLYFSNVHAVYYRNAELGVLGTRPQPVPGDERLEHLQSYSGQHITWSGYYFRFVGPRKAAARITRGVFAVPVVLLGAAFRQLPNVGSLPADKAFGTLLLAAALVGTRRVSRAALLPSTVTTAGGVLGYAALYRVLGHDPRLTGFLLIPLSLLVGACLNEIGVEKASTPRMPKP